MPCRIGSVVPPIGARQDRGETGLRQGGAHRAGVRPAASGTDRAEAGRFEGGPEPARRGGERADRRETGSVVVEALLTVLLLVPLVYLVVVIGRVQAGTFAAETAAREAVRAVVTAESAQRGAARADAAVRLALRDQDFPGDAGTLDLECEHPGCLTPDGDVAAVVRVAVPLPLVPGAVGAHVPAAVHVEAAHVGTVDRFRAVAP